MPLTEERMDLPGGAVGLDALPEVAARAHAMGWVVNVQFDGSEIEAHEAALAQRRGLGGQRTRDAVRSPRGLCA